MTLKELLEKSGAVGKEIRDMAALLGVESREDKNFTAEEQTKWDELNAEYDKLQAQITIAQRAADVDAELSQRAENEDRTQRDQPGREDRTPDTPQGHEVRGLAMQAWMRNQVDGEVSERQRIAAETAGVNLNAPELRLELPIVACQSLVDARRVLEWSVEERAKQSTITGASGGLLIPSTLLARLDMAMLAFGDMLTTSEIIRTPTGEEISWPGMDDTGNKGVQVGETEDRSTEQAIAFVATKWRAYPFSSKMVRVPNALLRDSAINLESMLGPILGERLGRIQQEKYTTGTGANTPYGIVERATTGVTTASATAITLNEVTDLEHSVDPAYRVGSGVGFMFHDSIIKYMRKLLDADGRPLWQPSIMAGTPDRLNGRPLHVNQEMASTVAATNTTMLFGDLSYYKIRQVGTIRLRRLVERYAEYDEVAFIAFIDCDGNLLDAGTHPVKAMVQHA